MNAELVIGTIDHAYDTVDEDNGQTTAAREAGLDVGGDPDLPRTVAHPFYARLNHVCDRHDVDGEVEGLCQRFYANDGRPGLPPGRCLRRCAALLIQAGGFYLGLVMRQLIGIGTQRGRRDAHGRARLCAYVVLDAAMTPRMRPGQAWRTDGIIAVRACGLSRGRFPPSDLPDKLRVYPRAAAQAAWRGLQDSTREGMTMKMRVSTFRRRMKRTLLAAGGAAGCAALVAASGAIVSAQAAPRAASGAATPAAPTATVLKAARLFDAKTGTVTPNAIVLIEGSTITAVGASAKIPAGATVIDLGDATLLPGFIDAHTHMSDESSENWFADTVGGLRRTVAESAIRATTFAHKTLMAGFTTIRDVGAAEYIDVGLRNGINAGYIDGPRMLVSVHALGSRGGHCDNTGFPYGLFGKETGIEDGVASGADQFRDAVRFQVKYGADVIKVCATGGVLSLADEVDTPQLTQAEMDALVDESHRLRKKTAAHAHGATGAKVAIRAGIDSIEHGSFLDEEGLKMMKERGTYLVPTVMAVESVSGKSGSRVFPPEIAAKGKAAAASHAAMMKQAIAMGVKIALGTDSAVSPHGHNAEEFGLLVDRGMTPSAALRAGTIEGAALLGLEKTIGSLDAGKAADIVAVPGDVLADIHATERVTFVMKGGRVYRHDSTKPTTSSASR